MRIKSADVMRGVIMAIGVVGVLAVAVTVPNLAAGLGSLYKLDKRYNRRQIKRSLDYMASREIIGIGKDGDKTVIKLTEKGKEKLIKYRIEDMKLSKPKRWDGKWRLVFSDIPEKYKPNRDAFSLKLKEIGFITLQKSVWIWPHECRDEVDMLKEVYEVAPFVRMALATTLDRKSELEKLFHLRN